MINKNSKKELYQLILANDSLNTALSTLTILEELQISNSGDDSMFHALQESLIISYGRAFTEMKPFWKISDEWSKFDDVNQQACHDQLSKARHKRYAHVDYFPEKVIMYPKGTLKISEDKFNEHTNHVVKFQVYSYHAYPLMRQTIQMGLTRMNYRIRDLIIDIYENREDFKQPEELISMDDLKELLSKKEYEKLMNNTIE